ncbi:hypothetical protein RCO48_26285 [Peribacillus frigoritolerans]|nr:hypothetical protein [Peribacillus frigoritolerans]
MIVTEGTRLLREYASKRSRRRRTPRADRPWKASACSGNQR